MFEEIFQALGETLLMLFISGIVSLLFSLALVTSLSYSKPTNKFISITRKLTSNVIKIINLTPFLLVLLFIAPVVKLLISINVPMTFAVSIPLILVGSAFFTQQLNKIFASVPQEVKELAYNIGASKFQLIFNFIIPEALPKIAKSTSDLMIKLLQLSTVAGVFGAGGLGYIAMQHCYYELNLTYMLVITGLILLLTKSFQLTGYLVAVKAIKR